MAAIASRLAYILADKSCHYSVNFYENAYRRLFIQPNLFTLKKKRSLYTYKNLLAIVLFQIIANKFVFYFFTKICFLDFYKNLFFN